MASIDANALLSGDQAFRFVGTAAFTGQGAASAGEMRATAVTGSSYMLLAVDVDGNGRADMEILVSGTTALAGPDFLL